ncbi:uncharacterized protein TM35_000012600 [Trypanosoma theileri]|uniref:Uncharacterized protein n=1 Tax=Trypanosoma theileri TaxID=67003 RepID=A0A1X0P9S2_9TRYP|nr:uncharacterized protein TM35_000012600 [Trypanosoma theileri]ORC93383.1 hypothetical protein TM35_000012600 [Trypanosoma theileri]
MHVPPPISHPPDLCMDGAVPAWLRQPPQTEQLLTCLADVLSTITRRDGKSATAQENTDPTPSMKRERETEDTVNDDCLTPESDTNTQKAFLNDLCLYLLSEKQYGEVGDASKVPLLLPFLPKGRNQKAKSIFLKLARRPYWRRKLLIPLLRHWRGKGESGYSFLYTLLLNCITDVIGEELLSPEFFLEKSIAVDTKPNTAEHEVLSSHKKEYFTQLMQDLEEMVKVTGSFRGMCVGIDIILRNNIVLLLKRVNQLMIRASSEGENVFLLEESNNEIEQIVNVMTQLTWQDMYTFLSKCVTDVKGIFDETMWTFFMSLISAYIGALYLLEMESLKSSNISSNTIKQIEAQRMFFESLQRELLNFLTVQLSTDRLAAGESLITVHNVLFRQTFHWKAIMEAELAMELLPNIFLSVPLVKSWARHQAITAWGRTVRLLQTFLQLQEVSEDVPNTIADADAADSISSAIRQSQRNLLEEYIENITCGNLRYFVSSDRERAKEERKREDKKCEKSWSVYFSEFFIQIYHPSCFTILSLEKQDILVDLLRQLYSLIMNQDFNDVKTSLKSLLISNFEGGVMGEANLLSWYVRCVHDRVVQALGENSPLLLCLLCSLFVLFERMGKTSLNVHETLRETLLPTLAKLCCDRSNDKGKDNNNNHHHHDDHYGDNDHDDEMDTVDGEDFYERQQCLMTLLVSGFLSLPWDLRGLRIRLLLYKSITQSLLNCFSAEEALTKVEHLFSLYTNGQQTPEEVVTAYCDDFIHDPFLKLLATEGDVTASKEAMDNVLLCDTPLWFPTPCGTLIILSIFRTLSHRLLWLRTEWEQQIRLVGESAQDYMGRQATFCTSRDIAIFRILVQLAHRMVFGFQLQPVGLLRLWISYLVHLFTYIVPPLTEDDEIELVISGSETEKSGNGKQLRQRRFRRSPTESSQGDLRASLGEQLADLALMPLVDSAIAVQSFSAVPYRPGSAKWLQQQSQHSQDILVLQRVLPNLVMEELCFALKISPENIKGQESSSKIGRHNGKMVEHSFLGVIGVAAFCQRLELFMVPGSISDRHTELLLQTLWSAVESSSTTRMT